MLPCPVCKEDIKFFCEKCPHCHSDLKKSDDSDGLGFFEWILVIIMLYFIFTW